MSFLSLLTRYKSNKPPTCTAVIAAAGTSQRCEGEDKLFYHINGKPVLAYTIEVFQNCKLIDEIIIVAREECFERISDIYFKYGFTKVTKIMKGGLTRPESVLNGILAASGKSRLIAIHDGARPCIDADVLERTIQSAGKYNAAAPAIAITSTIKKAETDFISETVEREGMYEIQTPQIFRAEIIKAALTKVMKKGISITDDCMAVEHLGIPVRIIEGSRKNLKITDKTDLEMVEALLSEK